MKNLMKLLIKNEKGILTIEASLVFVIFFLGYILINTFVLSSYTESNTKKAINSMALDLSNYSIILERAGISAYFEKGEDTDIFDDLTDLFNKHLEKEKLNAASIFKDLKDLCSKKLSNQAKSYLYNRTFRRLIKNYFRDEKYLLDKNIVDGYEGLDFSKSRILDKGEFEINLTYKIHFPFILPINISRNIKQQALISTNIESSGIEFLEEDDNSKSIWQEDNFTRGRYFAKHIRKDTKDLLLKLGQGVDLYSRESNKLTQFHSINVFSSFYSDEKDKNYKIKIDVIDNEIKSKIRLLEKNIEKLKNSIVLSDGQIIKINKNINKELLIIMPKEAKKYPQINKLIKSGNSDIKVRLIFMENAL